MLARLVRVPNLLMKKPNVVMGSWMIQAAVHCALEFLDRLLRVAACLQINGFGQITIDCGGGFELTGVAAGDVRHPQSFVFALVLRLLKQDPGQNG